MIDLKQLEMIVQNQKIGQLDKTGVRNTPSALKDLLGSTSPPFQDLLKQESLKYLADDLKFSSHAMTRLMSRNISLTQNDKVEIMQGLNKLQEKGAKDALMVVKDVAMIVSVNNKTVVTVMDKNGSNGDGIFTNIDSAMII